MGSFKFNSNLKLTANNNLDRDVLWSVAPLGAKMKGQQENLICIWIKIYMYMESSKWF